MTPAYVVLVTLLACGIGLASAASGASGWAAAGDRVFTSNGSVRIPKQPAASQPEAVPPATSLSADAAPVASAHFEEGWLLPLGGGLATLAALSVLMVAWSRNDNDDD